MKIAKSKNWEVRSTGVNGKHLGYVRAITKGYAQYLARRDYGRGTFVRLSNV